MFFHPFRPTILTQAITAWRSNPIACRIIEITTEFVPGEELFTDVMHHPANDRRGEGFSPGGKSHIQKPIYPTAPSITTSWMVWDCKPMSGLV